MRKNLFKPTKNIKKALKQFQEEPNEEEIKENSGLDLNNDTISVDGSIDLTNKPSKTNSFLARTVSLQRSGSLKNKPLFPEELNKPTISAIFNKADKIWNIKLDHKSYEFDIKKPEIGVFFEQDFNLKEILSNFDDFGPLYSQKQLHKVNEICKITDHTYYTCLDYYFEHLNLLLQAKIKSKDLENKIKTPDESELDRCCICQCDLYESILDYDPLKIKMNLSNNIKILNNSTSKTSKLTHISDNNDNNINSNIQEEVIKLDKCEGHYFHQSCFLSFLQSKPFIKCPICSLIYGIMTGDQPDGKMTYSLERFSHCEGFEKDQTIRIEYNMRGTQTNGVHYPPTHRIAYLPNNNEGKEVLNLLKTAFERRLIFTLGTSVTTGRTNQIVWNGIHHKTSLTGGASYFGYPDKTYFNRVKLELAAKGVY